MGRFIVRIELQDAIAEDYKVLDKAMLSAGFKSTIQASIGREYNLPTSEYFADTPDCIRFVYYEARIAAKTTRKKFYVIVSEIVEFMCDLEKTQYRLTV